MDIETSAKEMQLLPNYSTDSTDQAKGGHLILDTLESMNSDNWEQIRDEVIDLISQSSPMATLVDKADPGR